MKLKKISFSSVKNNYNDGNSLVFLGVILSQEECKDATSYFEENKLVPEGSIVDYYDISGNVQGDAGRRDVLIVLKEGTAVNPMKRLQFANMGITWTSDFVRNYAEDYSEAPVMEGCVC